MNDSVTGTVREVETFGQDQYRKYIDEQLPLLSRPTAKASSKGTL